MRNIILLLAFLSLCSMASAQINYDEEHEGECFSIYTTLNPAKSHHYNASYSIELNPGFSYTPARGMSALFDIDPMMVVPPTYGTAFSTAFDPNIAIQAPGGLPYSLPMRADVNNNGAAEITIPIDCPPGANGLIPDLSFIYNSHAGNGIMGQGWSIGGMSKISRVPFKYYYSDYSNAVNFTNEDDLSLDGNRLIKGIGNTYYPEVFDNSIVIFTNNSFIVKKPNGYVYTYGGTNDSKHYAEGIQTLPIEWHISSIKDPFDNTIVFLYESDDDGGFYPSQINYCGYTIEFEYHPSKRRDTQKKFFADSNGNNGFSKITKQLSRLNFSRGDEPIHSYHLDYMYQGALPNSELVSIQKFGTYDDESKPNPENRSASCQFVWNNSIGTLQKDETCDDINLCVNNIGTDFYQKNVFSARFNHWATSELSDIVVLLTQENTPYYKIVPIRNSSENNATNQNHIYQFDAMLNTDAVNDSIKNKSNCDLFSPVDIDGDGFNELLFIYHTFQGSNINYHARLITYNEETHSFEISQDINTIPTTPPQGGGLYEFYIGDFDGNSCSDILMTNGDFVRVCLSKDGAFNHPINNTSGQNLYLNSSIHKIYVGDFTGDGRDQLISMNKYTNNSYNTKKLSIVRNNNTLTMQIVQPTPNPEYLQLLFGDNKRCVHFCQGDFNGDNKQDFVAIMKGTEDRNWYFYLSKGDGSFEKRTWQNTTSFDEIATNFVPLPADFNGDGFTDLNISGKVHNDEEDYNYYYRFEYLIRVDDTIPKVIRKQITDELGQEQFATKIRCNNQGINRKNEVLTCIGNFRGTSVCELAYVNLSYSELNGTSQNNTNDLYLHLINTGDFDDAPNKAIVLARNGLGVNTQFEYVQHTYQGIYPENKERDPIIIYTRPYTQQLNVVKKMKTETDEGVTRDIFYQFSQPIMHTRGKGFLGFQYSRKRIECQGNNQSSALLWTDNSFKLNTDYYILYPDKTTTYYNNSIVNERNYVYEFLNLSSSYNGMPQEVFMPVLKKDDNTNYSNGRKTTTVFGNFDGYGNPQIITKTVNTTNPATQTYTKTTTYTYSNVTGNGHRLIGLVSSCSDRHTMGNNNITINSSYNYDNYGFMTQKVCNGIDETYSRDSYGNTVHINRIADNQTRSETMTYSNDGRFLKSHTDAMGNTTSYNYINRNGLLRSVTDHNGLVTTYHYDMLGNVIETDYPDGTKELFVKRWTISFCDAPCTEHPDMPTDGNPIYYKWSKRSGQPETTSFFDQHDRLLRTVTKDFSGRKIYQDYTYYNKSGLLHTESLPYFSNDGQPAGVTSYSYDYLDRPTAISKPGYKQYTHSYNGNKETVNDFDGSSTTIIYSSNGQPQKISRNGTTIEYSYFGDGKTMSSEVDGNNNTKVEYTYDANRQPLTISDPSLGLRTYSYNAFGELLVETNNKGQSTNYSYDALGRMTNRTDEDGSTTIWHYDSQIAGLLDYSLYEPADTDEPSIKESSEYDKLGRLIYQEQSLGGAERAISFSYSYNKHGNIKSIIYPSGYTLAYCYDQDGNMLLAKDPSNGNVLWSATSSDQFGNITEFTLGNNINVSRTYDNQTGLAANFTATGNTIFQNLEYQWDNRGNLSRRHDHIFNHYENFTYDNLNRLTNIEIDGNESHNIIYDNLGNISFKYDAGSMIYNSTNPYAVKMITDVSDITSFGGSQDVTYTSFDKVKSISQDNKNLHISYGADRQRVRQTLNVGEVSKTKRYFTPRYETISTGGTTKKIHYLTSSTGLFAIFALESNNSGTMSYVIKDHQGSLNATVTGGAVSHYGFDAWGRRRDPQTLSYDNATASLDRGYTLHEHYDEFGLINMNGRLYDPLIGRMLSPDIVIQDEQNSQAFNRYSYCLNKPLRFTDPSGYVTTIPPEFEIYYYPELIGSYDAYIDKLTEAGAKNINIHNTDESEGKTTTTISWSVGDNSFQMTIVDQHLKDYEQICQNSCVATTLVAQEMRYSYGNPDITEKWIMSTDKESYNNGLFVDKALYKYLEKTSVYKKASYSTKDDLLDYEKHAYREMYDDNGVFFNFIGEHGHVVNASVGIEFLLNGQVLNHEIRIWDAGKENGCTAGFRSLNFYNHPDKISHKMGILYHKKHWQ